MPSDSPPIFLTKKYFLNPNNTQCKKKVKKKYKKKPFFSI